MDKILGITDVVMIGERLSTILAEARAKTDLRLQVDYGVSEDGVPFERYAVVVHVGPGRWQSFNIRERDFKFLRWTGIDVGVVAGPKDCRALNRNRSSTGHLLTTE